MSVCVTLFDRHRLLFMYFYHLERRSAALFGTSTMTHLPEVCTMPKRHAVVIFPEVNHELSLVMETVKRDSWRQSTSSLKIGILVLIMHTAWSPNTSS
jgi:hypothetical protein